MKKTLVTGALWLGTVASQAMAQDTVPQQGKDGTPESVPAAVIQSTEPGALDAIKVFADLDPYFEQKNSTALKGTVDEDRIPFTTNVLNSQVIEDLKADRLEKAFDYITGFTRSGPIANSFTIRGQSADL
ncbi:MAG: hypothetical protein ABJF07_02005, partial [Nisaea sp.]